MRTLLFVVIAITIALPNSSYAQSVDKWFNDVSKTGTVYYAATINNSGNLLGQFCYPATGNCIWLLGLKTACKEGEKYPVLVNSDKGSAHMNVYCSAQLDSGLYRYVITEYDAINNIVTNALRVGFALPLQEDQFRVVRFDLSDSNRAIAKMVSAATKAQKKSSSKTTGTTDEDI